MIRQTEAAECGLACLSMVARHHGQDVDLATLRRRFPISIKGSTLKSIIEIGSAIGLGSRAVRCELGDLSDLKLPAILHWGMNHFVVLHRVRGNRLTILDPDAGERRLTLNESSAFFTGVALGV